MFEEIFDELTDKLEALKEGFKERFDEIDWNGKTKILLFSVILLGVFCGFAFASYQTTIIFKPYVMVLEDRELPISINNINFHINPLTDICDYVIFNITNLDDVLNFDNLTISVLLFDANNTVIAENTITNFGLNAGETKTVSITLNWVENKTVFDVSKRKIMVTTPTP